MSRMNKTGVWGVHIAHNIIDKKLKINLYTCSQCGYKYRDYPGNTIKDECPACGASMKEHMDISGAGYA